MPQFLSEEFFHLVGRASPEDHDNNYDTLMKILREGCIRYWGAVPGQSRTSIEVDLTKTLLSGELVVPTMTCYCDIPLESLTFHAAKYGQFGLSFHRDFLIRYGARPVLYIPTRSDDRSSAHGLTLLREIEGIYKAYRAHLLDPLLNHKEPPHIQHRERVRRVGGMPDRQKSTIEALDSLLTFQFLGYLKPYDSELPESDPNYYYSEREWRLTNYLRFVPIDIAHVVVSAGYAERLVQEMPHYCGRLTALKVP